MFGHSDDSHKDEHDEPQHDGVLSGGDNTVHPDADLPAPHDDPAASPAFTSAAPAFPAPKSDDDHTEEPAKEDDADSDKTDSSAPAPNDDLLDLKTSALKQLSPLVDHLDQTPEEKFRTTMMLIQASDDQSLLKDAYEAAQKITDEKIKAQALLDVVNEINYFTHQDKN